MNSTEKHWEILCHDCNMLKTDHGARKVGTEERWYWRCVDCDKRLEDVLGDLGIL